MTLFNLQPEIFPDFTYYCKAVFILKRCWQSMRIYKQKLSQNCDSAVMAWQPSRIEHCLFLTQETNSHSFLHYFDIAFMISCLKRQPFESNPFQKENRLTDVLCNSRFARILFLEVFRYQYTCIIVIGKVGMIYSLTLCKMFGTMITSRIHIITTNWN